MLFPHEPHHHTKEEMEFRAREVKRGFKTPLSVWFIVISMTLLLLFIGGLVLANGFHFW